MKAILLAASRAFLNELDRYTLDDLVRKSAAPEKKNSSRGKIVAILPAGQRLHKTEYTADQA